MKKMFFGLLIVSLMVSMVIAAPARNRAAASSAAGRVATGIATAVTATSVQIPYANESAVAKSRGDAFAEALSSGNFTASARNNTDTILTTANVSTATAGYKTALINVPAGRVLILTANLTVGETAASTSLTHGCLEINRVETITSGDKVYEVEKAAQLTDGKWRKTITWLANEAPSGSQTIVTKPLPYSGKYRASVTFSTSVYAKNSSSRVSGVIRSVSLKAQ